jgi:hypothetical protein
MPMEESTNEKADLVSEEQEPGGGTNEKADLVSEEQEPGGGTGFFHKYGPIIFFVGFALYLVLLGIGVVAEIFDIQSILDWWIWRTPGR